jgi:RNA-binding protein YhbY
MIKKMNLILIILIQIIVNLLMRKVKKKMINQKAIKLGKRVVKINGFFFIKFRSNKQKNKINLNFNFGHEKKDIFLF